MADNLHSWLRREGSILASAARGIDGAFSDETDYREIVDRIDLGFCVIEVMFDGRESPVDYRFLETNAAFESQTGLQCAIGRTMRSFEPDHEDYWFEIYGDVALTGNPVRFERQAALLGRHYDVYAFRIGAPHLRRVAVLFEDITKRKREEERLALISAELDHRAKNLFAVISSILRLTEADTVEEYKTKLSGRINSLVSSNDLFLPGEEAGADLAELVARELAIPCSEEEERVAWSGPQVHLSRKSAQPVALALHELATNAMKYGSLSNSAGRLRLSWSWCDDRRHLEIRWVESGGPTVCQPTRRGTGSDVIAAAIERQLDGTVAFDWRPEGLSCTITLPADAFSG